MTLIVSAAQAADLPKTRTPIAAPDTADASGDARAIITLLDRLSTAIAAKDAAALAALFDPGAVIYDTRYAPDGSPKLDRQTPAEWSAMIGRVTQPVEERIGRPDITISETAASAVAPYTVFLDGKLHHCGTDHFQLVRTPAGWRIVAITYNLMTEGCAR